MGASALEKFDVRSGQKRARPAVAFSLLAREALAKLIPAFKQQLGELMQSGAPIPWIDPPLDPDPAEQTRFIPIHL